MLLADLMIFCPIGPTNFKNSGVIKCLPFRISKINHE
jgi:hypothetical protein